MSKKVRSLITVSEHHCKELYDDLQAMPPAYRASRLRSLAILGIAALNGVEHKPGCVLPVTPDKDSDATDDAPSPESGLTGIDLER